MKIYDGSFGKIVSNVNFKPLTLQALLTNFTYFSLTSISRDTFKWLLSRFVFPVKKGSVIEYKRKVFTGERSFSHEWFVFLGFTDI